MRKSFAFIDRPKGTYNGDINLDKLVEEDYTLRVGKYNGSQKTISDLYYNLLRSNGKNGYDGVEMYKEHYSKVERQSMNNTNNFSILYDVSDETGRYRNIKIRDEEGFNEILFNVFGKDYKFVPEIVREYYRNRLGQIIGNDVNDIQLIEFAVVNNIKPQKLKTMELVNGPYSAVYNILDYFGVDVYGIEKLR